MARGRDLPGTANAKGLAALTSANPSPFMVAGAQRMSGGTASKRPRGSSPQPTEPDELLRYILGLANTASC
jgi:hypothetical protein